MTALANDLAGLTPTQRKLLELALKKKGIELARHQILPRATHAETCPLSFGQQRLWFLHQLQPDNPAYNVTAPLRVEGGLDPAALRRALAALVARHETLRTSFPMVDEQVAQKVAAHAPDRLGVVDLRRLGGADREREAAWLTNDNFRRPFDLEHGPLLRSVLVQLDAERDDLLICMHHTVSDGLSVGIFFRELWALYGACARGEPVARAAAALPKLPIQYVDFALWQREQLAGEKLAEQLDYWRRQLAGLPPLLDLPVDRPWPAVRGHRGGGVAVSLSAATTAAVRKLAQESRTTPFVVLLATLQLLLQRSTRESKIAVGTSIGGRGRQEIEGLIGFFVNTQVLYTDFGRLPAGPSQTRFRQLIETVRQVNEGANAHQDLPFERLVEELQPDRSLNHSPLFQVNFVFQAQPPGSGMAIGGVRAALRSVSETPAMFELHLALSDRGATIGGSLAYSRDLFDATTAARLMHHYAILLEAALAAPDGALAVLPIWGAAERHQVLREWNPALADPRPPGPPWLHERFWALARRDPARPALVFAGEAGCQTLGYGELAARAAHLASRLRALGVGRDRLVGLCAERSLEMVVGIYGVLLAGGAWVPLDPGYPAERLDFMLADSGVEVVLTQSHLAPQLGQPGRTLLVLDHEPWPAPSAGPPDFELPELCAENLAYMIYTSGSTGRPKGAMNSHGAILNRILWMQEEFRLETDDRVLQKTPFSFDVSVWEFLWPLAVAARLVVAKPQGHQDPEYLAELIARESITTLHFVPSMLRAFLEQPDLSGCGSLRRAIASGEALSADLARQLGERLDAGLHNLYGPTEAAIDVTYQACTRLRAGAPGVPIGRPIAHTWVVVLDRELRPVPIGIAGELALGGVGLARGYRARPALTAEKFVPDGVSERAGARLYKTGDLVRALADGALDYLDRLDFQVKIRGFRIELGEIEAVLARHPEIRETAVIASAAEPGGGARRLLAYYVAAAGAGELGPRELRSFCAERLPEHMVPAFFVRLEAMPLSPNGKLDRKSLPAPESAAGGTETWVEPRTETETQLAAIWQALLRRERVGMHENFFEIGGDSILGLQMISRAARLGIRLKPRQIFQHQTLAELAAVADREQAGPAAVESEQGVLVGEVPLTPIQSWFRELPLGVPRHFNQSFLLAVAPAPAPALLARAVAVLERHHDALRARFDLAAGRQWWVEPDGRSFAHLDLGRLDAGDRPRALRAVWSRAQSGFDLARGPLFRALLASAEGFARLLLVAHHLVIDGVSWRILLEDLPRLTTQLGRGETPALPAKTTSYRVWAEHLRRAASRPELRAELARWLGDPAPTELPLAAPTALEPAGAPTLTAALEPDETRVLLETLPVAYRARVDDAILTALARVLARRGAARLAIDVEGHGREPLDDTLDLSRTVGWLTAIYPLVLAAASDEDVGTTLKRIKQRQREVRHGGLGFGVLRHLGSDEDRRALAALPTAELVLNYLGQLDTGGERTATDASTAPGVRFVPSSEFAGTTRAPGDRRPYPLELVAAVSGGRLGVSLTWERGRLARSEVASLLADLVAELRAVIAHCRQPEAGGCTPSDFPLAGLDQPTLDRLFGHDREIEDVYPLAPAQEGMLFFRLYDPGSLAYLQQATRRLHGQLDVAAFAAAWAELLASHPVLRSCCVWDGLERPLQVVRRNVELPLTRADWRHLDGAEQDRRLAAHLAEDRGRGFALDRAPLLRLELIRLGEDVHLFVWTWHHVLLDGWSLALLRNELFSRYARRCGLALPAPVPVRPFRDFIGWLATFPEGAAEAFWRRELVGFSEPISLGLEPASVAPKRHQERFRAHPLNLAPALTDGLRALAASAGVTLNSLVQAAWAVLLARWSGQRDVLFGATTSGRSAPLEGIEAMIGVFINTLPVRVDVDPAAPLGRWLRALQDHQAEAREHEHTRLVQIQQWCEVPATRPPFETLVVFENYPQETGFGAGGGAPGAGTPGAGARVRAEMVQMFERTSYPVTVVVQPAEGWLNFLLGFDQRLFELPMIERLLGALAELLAAMGGGGGERPLAALGMLPESVRRQLLDVNQTAVARPEEQIETAIAERAAALPDVIAVVDGERHLSYGALVRRAGAAAARLRRRGVGAETRVVVLLERSPEMVVAILGVLGAGGAYVPLDPATPPARLVSALADTGARLVLTSAALAERIPAGTAEILLAGELGEGDGVPPAASATGRNLAYLIYTSGSTGRPKAVMIERRALADYARTAAELALLGVGDRVLQFASLAFDASAEEIYPCLLRGATLVLRDDEMLDLGHFLEVCAAWRITVLDLPTAFWHELAAVVDGEGLAIPAALRLLILGGEQARAETVARWLALAPAVRLVNTYGPTEATVVATLAALGTPRMLETHSGRVWEEAPIGRPRANSRVFVRDSWGELAPVGVAGELLLGGLGLARGYLARPALSAAVFVPDPWSDEPGARLYRSGDRARFRPDLQLEFLGRRDRQVKIRGFRIELGEIESALAAHPAVRAAAVVAVGGAVARLIAFLEPAASALPDAEVLRSFLRARLPAHMVPASLVWHDPLPRTASGKLDRRALPASEELAPAAERLAPRDEVERRLAVIFEQLFERREIDVRADFFALGGNSILALRLIVELRRAFGRELPLAVVFERPSLEALAELLRREEVAAAGSPLVAIRREGRRPPLFFAHPGGGTVLCYRELAAQLGTDQPFFAFESPGLDGRQAPLTTIEEMAACYVEALRGWQPVGPYRVGGWSTGGVVAYAMAVLLEQMGERVEHLVLFDTLAPARFPHWSDGELRMQLGVSLGVPVLPGSALPPERFLALDPEAQLAHVGERARRRGSLGAEEGPERLQRLYEVFRNNVRAVERYTPPSWDGRLLYFRPEHERGQSDDGTVKGWSEHAREIRVEWVPGTHGSMVAEPHVAVLARKLRTALDAGAKT